MNSIQLELINWSKWFFGDSIKEIDIISDYELEITVDNSIVRVCLINNFEIGCSLKTD